MGVDSGRIVGEPFVQIRHFWQRPIVSGFAAPGQCEFVDDDGTVTEVCRNPEFEGQMYFQLLRGGNTYMAAMYIAVDISGTLTFVKARLGETINSYTGRPIDPMAP